MHEKQGHQNRAHEETSTSSSPIRSGCSCSSDRTGPSKSRPNLISVVRIRPRVKFVKQWRAGLHADVDFCSFAIAVVVHSGQKRSLQRLAGASTKISSVHRAAVQQQSRVQRKGHPLGYQRKNSHNKATLEPKHLSTYSHSPDDAEVHIRFLSP